MRSKKEKRRWSEGRGSAAATRRGIRTLPTTALDAAGEGDGEREREREDDDNPWRRRNDELLRYVWLLFPVSALLCLLRLPRFTRPLFLERWSLPHLVRSCPAPCFSHLRLLVQGYWGNQASPFLTLFFTEAHPPMVLRWIPYLCMISKYGMIKVHI